jgi:hypothetical protein
MEVSPMHSTVQELLISYHGMLASAPPAVCIHNSVLRSEEIGRQGEKIKNKKTMRWAGSQLYSFRRIWHGMNAARAVRVRVRVSDLFG